MKYEISLSDIPSLWINFRDDFVNRQSTSMGLADGLILELLKWNAVLKTTASTGTKASLVFKTESDAIMFKLRWS